jgi:uncharacterized membrane protein
MTLLFLLRIISLILLIVLLIRMAGAIRNEEER